MPFPTEFEFDVAGEMKSIGGTVDTVLRGLALKSWEVVWDGSSRIVGNGEVSENVWSRAARRAKARGVEKEGEGEDVALGFRVEVGSKENDEGSEVFVRWTRGTDTVLFESFCGMLKRKIQEVGKSS